LLCCYHVPSLSLIGGAEGEGSLALGPV
jgi:hypothetical protein